MEIVSGIGESKLFLGMMMMVMNLGSRYIVLELSHNQEQFISGEMFRKFVIFAMAYVATRDIVTALILTAVFTTLVMGLFNERSEMCIIPSLRGGSCKPTSHEIEHAKKVLERAQE